MSRTIAGAAAAPSGTARLSALHRGLALANQRLCSAPAALPGTWRHRVLPEIFPCPQSSELLADRSLIPAGRCPEPPGNGVTSPVRRHRTRPVNWPSPVTSLPGRAYVTETVTVSI